MIKNNNEITPDPYERRDWFRARIGKTIYRNKVSCGCGVCENVYDSGLMLFDQMHADYVSDMEGISNIEGHPLRYFDTKEEVVIFEENLNK